MDPLRLEDILHYSPIYDPLAAAPLYDFPREPNSPNPFKRTFSYDEFRAFWALERNAFQWLYCSQGNSRSFYEKKPQDLDAPLPVYMQLLTEEKRGRPREYDWSVKHVCRHGDSEKNLSSGRDSVGQGCPASIRICKKVNQDRVEIEYHWRHKHSNSFTARANFPLGSNDRNWYRGKVSEGYDWKGMKKHFLTPPKDKLQMLEQGKENLPPGFLINYDHVRGGMYRARTKASQKDKDVVKSVEEWIKQIEEDKDPKHFMIAWCSAFQLQIMSENKLIACMDSTHKTVKALRPKEKSLEHPPVHPSSYLFTILVKDRQVQRGIPIAFMITNSESKYRLIKWLTWLKTVCNFETEKFMVDCAQVEFDALKAVFPNSSVFHCLFHVGQLWEKHLRESCNLEECNKLRPGLKDIRHATSRGKLFELWNTSKENNKRKKTLIKYIEDNWINEKKMPTWVNFVRRNYQHVDTNNLVESWHKTLKKVHLGHERNVRADYLIYLLHDIVNTDFRVTYLKIKTGLLSVELSTYDKTRKAKAMRLEHSLAKDMVTEHMNESKFEVKSFSRPTEVQYSVKVNMETSLLLSCSCEDYDRHRIPCKHLYLVQRVYNVFGLNYDSAPLPKPAHDSMNSMDNLESNDVFGPPLEETISQHLALQLQASRAREQAQRADDEVNRKRAREEAIAREFGVCELELKHLWMELGKVVHPSENGKRRKCTLEYMQGATAALKAAIREVKGVDEVGAGRRCR